jgi:hypothetical protein
MRSALLSVGTTICFRLSGPDADKMASIFGGGNRLAESFRNLPPREFIAKIGHQNFVHGRVPDLPELSIDPADLYQRCCQRWAKPSAEIEQEILTRYRTVNRKGGLDEWE